MSKIEINSPVPELTLEGTNNTTFSISNYVGKNLVMKRFRPRARGRTGKILKPFSQLTIILREKAEGEKK